MFDSNRPPHWYLLRRVWELAFNMLSHFQQGWLATMVCVEVIGVMVSPRSPSAMK